MSSVPPTKEETNNNSENRAVRKAHDDVQDAIVDGEIVHAKESAAELKLPVQETPIVSLEPRQIIGAAEVDYERQVTMPNGYNFDNNNVNWNNHHYHMVTADPGPVCCGGRDCFPWMYN